MPPNRGRSYTHVALSAALLACGAGADGGAPAERYRGTVVDPPFEKVAFTLTDQHERAFDFRGETDGFVTLLFFGYTHCPDICPVHLANIAAALRKMTPTQRREVKVVFVTTDPDRDTPERLRAWLGAIEPTFVGLTGRPTAIDTVLRALKMPEINRQPLGEDRYDVIHAAYVITYGKDGRGHLIHPFGIRQVDWVHDLTALVEDGFQP